MPPALAAILWVAVSSEAQAADDRESLRAQERDLRAVAEREGWQIVDVLIIPGFSRDYYTFQEFADDAARQGITGPLRLFDHWRLKDFDLIGCWDGSRFGRKQSIFAEFIARTLDADARIFSLKDGWVDQHNRHMFTAMGGYKAAKDISDLVDRHRMAMAANRERGLPISTHLLLTHVRVRDERGKVIAIRLDESKRQMWTDLAALVLEGVAWHNLEVEMFNRFGYGRDGRPRHLTAFSRLLYKPAFWGHLAQHMVGKTSGLWAVEPGHDLPPGVLISYNVIPPVYSGELAERVKAELRRRKEIGHGKGNTSQIRWTRGLFVCASCGYTLMYAYSGEKKDRAYVRCYSNSARTQRHCDRPALIPERAARAYITALLSRAIEVGADALIAANAPAIDLTGLRQSLDTLAGQARKLVQQRLDFAGTDIEAIYTAQLQRVSDEMTAARRRIAEAERQLSARQTPSLGTLDELKRITIEGFWNLSGDRQNQILHLLMGDLRILVTGREIGPLIRKR